MTKKEKRDYGRKYYLEHKDQITAVNKAYVAKNKEAAAARKQKWADENRERVRANHLAWRTRNRKHVNSKNKDWKHANKEKVAQSAVDYYNSHKDECDQRQRKWKRKNKDKVNATARKSYQKHIHARRTAAVIDKSRRRALHRNLPIKDRKAIDAWIKSWRSKLKVTCYWCLVKLPGNKAQHDHIIPLARGGHHCLSNLCISCGPCNRQKNDNMPEVFLKQAGLSHPVFSPPLLL